MGFRGIAILLLIGCLAAPVFSQTRQSNEQLVLSGKTATTWTRGSATIVQLEGPVTIRFDGATMSARRAVAWLEPVAERNLDVQSLQVALIGDARVEREQVVRSGDTLFTTTLIRGSDILIAADNRVPRDLSSSVLYQQAEAMRQAQGPATRISPNTLSDEHNTGAATNPAATQPTTRATRAQPAPEVPVDFASQNLETIQIDDGTVAVVLTGSVKLIQQRPTGDFIELQSDRAVLFTPLRSLKELTGNGERNRRISQTVIGAYLEGDVRIEYQPNKKNMGEQRLRAERVYYDFTSDRAILTTAILHTNDPTRGMPMTARAKIIRQLSIGEYSVQNVQLSSSSFAVPSLSFAADKLYIRQEPSDNPEDGERVMFQGQGVTFQAFDVPFFYLPYASGSLERGEALRSIGFGNSNIFGVEANAEFGLFESLLGKLPPRDLDVNYRLDYFSQRGPGFGLNAAYGGGMLTDTNHDPLDFGGAFRSYFVYDHGIDNLGRLPARVDAGTDLRGMALWEHQHFFPDNWTAQFRLGWVSDATFLEQWFRRDFETGPPHDLMGYLKHQDQTEAFTFLVEDQPSHVVTTSNMQQEQFEVERLPEAGYWRIGDSFADDKLTFFSENRAGGLHYQTSSTPITQQGFLLPTFTPGLPALGTTGLTKDVVWRGDFRQEVDYPFSAGPFRAVPYVFGRYTAYSEQPDNPVRPRGFIGAGARISTEIWKTDPTIESDLLDIHQLRHVIEPQLNLFTSATSVDNTRVFIYDQEVDKINDVSAIQLGLNQRWQTKRGGPGSWRSSDVFTFNVDVDWFANKPPKSVRKPYNFRGLFFESLPEASVPRDAVNANGSWRISDNTILLTDASWNLDKSEIQTLSLGVLVRRDTRLSYFIGNRYISDANSNITSVHADYEISKKYVVSVDQEFDFTHGQNVYSNVSLVRRFDTFYLIGRYFFDEVTGENGFSVNVIPLGFGQGVDTGSFQTYRR